MLRHLHPVVRDPLKGIAYRVWPNVLWIRERGDYDWWVVSHGGVKTTTLMEFLQRYGRVNDPYDSRNLKHIARPPTRLLPRSTYVYVYGDPVQAVISLYRRQFARPASRKTGNIALRPVPDTVAELAAREHDALGITRHLEVWLKAAQYTPVIFVDSERLWTATADILTALGIPDGHHKFPAEQPRHADREALEATTRTRLQRIYQPYASLVAGFAAAEIPARWSSVQGKCFQPRQDLG